MIVTDESAARWIRELARFLPLKNVLFLYGNILDVVSFAEKDENGRIESIVGMPLDTFLERFLHGMGYEVVGSYDPVVGLRFLEKDMESLYDGIQRPESTSGVGHREADSADPGSRYQSRIPRGRAAALADSRATVMDGIATAIGNHRTSCAFVLNHASRLVASRNSLTTDESELFTRLYRGTLNAERTYKTKLKNLVILVCDKLNDLPTYLYLNHPGARSICIDKPNTEERSRWFETSMIDFFKGDQIAAEQENSIKGRFSALTDGFAYKELLELALLSQVEQLPIDPPEPLVQRYKYGVTQSEWDAPVLRDRMKNAESFIRQRVKGQDEAVTRTVDVIKRALLGLAAGTKRRTHRPRGVLFFAGPTGVGKTELAKALAELLFNNSENRLIRFDMSEFSSEHSDQRLLGAPPSYVGYEEGGQLTNAVKERPFSVLLFDEIDKADPSILDKFLQILDDGRLTDGKGETVYFSECIIIFTSNEGVKALNGRLSDLRNDLTANGKHASELLPYKDVKTILLGEIRKKFEVTIGRPEILNRFGDNFVVFDFIRPGVAEEIVNLLIGDLQKALVEERSIELTVGDSAREWILTTALKDLSFGGRGIRNLIDTALVNPLARWLFDQDIKTNASLLLKNIRDNGNEEDESSNSNAQHRFELEIVQQSKCR